MYLLIQHIEIYETNSKNFDELCWRAETKGKWETSLSMMIGAYIEKGILTTAFWPPVTIEMSPISIGRSNNIRTCKVEKRKR